MKKDTIKLVISIVGKELSVRPVGLDDFFYEDLYADSLDFLDLINKTEKQFNISIEDDELAEIETVRDLVKCVEKKL